MVMLWKAMLGRVRWGELDSGAGPASYVADAVARFVTAETPDSAEDAYWRLDNGVVVQQNIHESAVEVVPVMLALLAGELPPYKQALVLDLLIEIGNGNDIPWQDHPPLHREMRKAADDAFRAGGWLYLQQTLNDDPNVRRNAVDAVRILERLDERRPRVLERLGGTDLLDVFLAGQDDVSAAVRALATASTTVAAGEREKVLAANGSASLARALLAVLAVRPPSPAWVAVSRLLLGMAESGAHAAVAEGLWLYYQGLLHDDPDVRAASVPLLMATEPDQARLRDVLA